MSTPNDTVIHVQAKSKYLLQSEDGEALIVDHIRKVTLLIAIYILMKI